MPRCAAWPARCTDWPIRKCWCGWPNSVKASGTRPSRTSNCPTTFGKRWTLDRYVHTAKFFRTFCAPFSVVFTAYFARRWSQGTVTPCCGRPILATRASVNSRWNISQRIPCLNSFRKSTKLYRTFCWSRARRKTRGRMSTRTAAFSCRYFWSSASLVALLSIDWLIDWTTWVVMMSPSIDWLIDWSAWVAMMSCYDWLIDFYDSKKFHHVPFLR